MAKWETSPRMFTLAAFIIGYLLIDDLDSSEQNALGNFFMLLGQTLCTNASEHFVVERKSETRTTPKKESDYTKNVLMKTRNAIDKYLNNY